MTIMVSVSRQRMTSSLWNQSSQRRTSLSLKFPLMSSSRNSCRIQQPISLDGGTHKVGDRNTSGCCFLRGPTDTTTHVSGHSRQFISTSLTSTVGRASHLHPARSRSIQQLAIAALSTQSAQVAGYYNTTTTNSSPLPKMILHLHHHMMDCSIGEEEEDDEEGT